MSTREVAHMYQVTSAAVLNWIHTGKLKAYATPGGHYRVAREDLDAFAREYSPPPAPRSLPSDLRLLLVGADHDFFERLRNAVQFRWPLAQVEHACTEFEVGWWLARLRPGYIVIQPDRVSVDLLEHCRSLVGEGLHETSLVELGGNTDDGLGEWINQLGADRVSDKR
ncbi:MAG TPA: helix-turn-helix domain-containing protein [Anaerolineae bacterium]